MIRQGFVLIETRGTTKIGIADILSKGAPTNFPLNGENVTGFNENYVFYPGSTIYDSENSEVYMLQEDYTYKLQ